MGAPTTQMCPPTLARYVGTSASLSATMDYSPEYLSQRRKPRPPHRRRRAFALVGLVLVLCIAGLGAFLLTSSRHHIVLVIRAAAPRQTSGSTSAGTEYQTAPGAANLKTIRSRLAAAQGKHEEGASTTANSGHGVLAANAASSFQAFASSLPGRVEIAAIPLGVGPAEVLGPNEPAHGWSTTKVPVLVSLLRARGAEGLTSQEQQFAQSAITESSNEAVLALFSDLEGLEHGLQGASRFMEDVLRASGDSETVVATAPPPPGAVTTFGQTEWRPSEAIKFFRALALGPAPFQPDQLRAQPDGEHRAGRELGPRLRRVQLGRVQGRLGSGTKRLPSAPVRNH